MSELLVVLLVIANIALMRMHRSLSGDLRKTTSLLEAKSADMKLSENNPLPYIIPGDLTEDLSPFSYSPTAFSYSPTESSPSPYLKLYSSIKPPPSKSYKTNDSIEAYEQASKDFAEALTDAYKSLVYVPVKNTYSNSISTYLGQFYDLTQEVEGCHDCRLELEKSPLEPLPDKPVWDLFNPAKYANSKGSLSTYIVHLNDHHKFSREAIAARLEELDSIDLTLKPSALEKLKNKESE